jgi:hypothetical protein
MTPRVRVDAKVAGEFEVPVVRGILRLAGAFREVARF